MISSIDFQQKMEDNKPEIINDEDENDDEI